MIWEGHFQFNFGVLPKQPAIGWKIGRSAADFLTPNRWSHYPPALGIRGEHAIFNINTDTGHMRLVSRGSASGPSQVSVNGRNVSRGGVHALNQRDMTLRLGPLEFLFSYTDFARTRQYTEQRRDYIRRFLGVDVDVDLSPTPNDNSWTFGSWTINGALRKGTSGRVYHATDVKGLAAAIKLVERHPGREDIIKKEIQTLTALTALAEKENDGGRLLRLRDVIRHDRDPSAKWGDIGLVLEPVLAETFLDLLEKAKAKRHSSAPC